MTTLPNRGQSRIDVSFFDPKKEQQVKRQRLLAQQLMETGQQPTQSEVVSGIVVPQSPIAGLAKALTTGLAGYTEGKANKAEDEVSEQRRQLMAQAIGQLGTDPRAAAATLMQDPQSAGIGMKLYMDDLNNQQQMGIKSQEWEREDKRDAAKLENALKVANIRANAAAGGGYTVDPDTGATIPTYSNKPLPVQALKLQNEAVDAIGAAGNISDNANNIINQIDSGSLELGPVKNLVNKARNWAGASSPESQNFAAMQTTLEKVRNDTLRLNKGVQTEGDAERALNEVINSVNDPAVFKNAMAKLDAINQRAAELQKLQVNNIRGNYNAAPYDFDQVGALPSAVPKQNGQADKIRQYLSTKGLPPEKIDAYLKAKGL